MWAQYAVEFERRERPNDAFSMTGSDHLGITDLRFVVEPAPNVTGEVPPETRYLAKSWPPVTVSVENRRTVLDVGGIDDRVDATMHFTLDVESVEGGGRQALVAVEASFTTGDPLGRYRLRDSEVYDLPTPESA